VGIYKRGEKLHDPQTGKFIGYEVRRAGVAKVTDKISEESCAVRVVRTNEDIEIGDLVRRGE
jgi:tRNA G46 methylase TrmB